MPVYVRCTTVGSIIAFCLPIEWLLLIIMYYCVENVEFWSWVDHLAVCAFTEKKNNKREKNKWFHLTTMRKIHRSHWVRCVIGIWLLFPVIVCTPCCTLHMLHQYIRSNWSAFGNILKFKERSKCWMPFTYDGTYYFLFLIRLRRTQTIKFIVKHIHSSWALGQK